MAMIGVGFFYSCLFRGYFPPESCSILLFHFIPASEGWTLHRANGPKNDHEPLDTIGALMHNTAHSAIIRN